MKTQHTLLVGNGLSRTTKNGYSWEKVVKSLASKANMKYDKNDNTVPFPLLYEKFFLNCTKMHYNEDVDKKQHGTKKQDYEDEYKKQYVAKPMEDIPHNEFHKQIASAGFKHIITTNYDYCIQYSVMKDWNPSYSKKDETRYRLYKRHLLGNTNIWHIHGEINKHKTIMLGQEHYSGALSHMRHYILGDNKKHSAFAKMRDFDTRPEEKYSWTDVFLRDNVHIVGLGLDFCEIDLWWLLVIKERIRSKKLDFPFPIEHKVGETYYYYRDKDLDEKEEIDRISMLKSLGVKTMPIPLNKDIWDQDTWNEYYQKVLNKIIKEKQG
ncbi:hypothetical protein LCGC14_2184360 [marine sediment metagenome]|uniref:Uncharacterized protein n=1 Tax=marine sediment metagenome TaxID=412755 RepID=A0A0F9E8F2_9ZZZZ